MFNLFKKKNKIKELETRILVLESNITKLNAQKENNIDFSKSWGESVSLKGCTLLCNRNVNGEIKAEKLPLNSKYEIGSKINDTHAIIPLENIEFLSKLANELSIAIEKNKESKSNKVNGDLILQIDGNVVGKVALNQLKKMQRQGGITLIPV